MFNYDAILPSGQLQTTVTGTPDTYLGGVGYVGQKVLVSTGAVDSKDTYANGLRFAPSGAVRVVNAAGDVFRNGIGFTDDGQMCVSTSAGDVVLNSLSISDDGRVYVSAIV